MKKLLAVFLMSVLCLTSTAWAETEDIEKDDEPQATEQKSAEWENTIKTKYNLTDQQISDMKAKGYNSRQMVKAAQLAKSANKPLEDIVKMRTEQKMGWGKIAKELGVHPKEIGHAVRDLRHEMKADHKAEKEAQKEARKEEKEQKREEKRAAREQKRAEKRESKEERRAEKKEKKDK